MALPPKLDDLTKRQRTTMRWQNMKRVYPSLFGKPRKLKLPKPLPKPPKPRSPAPRTLPRYGKGSA